ncbi:MAG: branched-chain amino acid ABC transporter substrate-binding protein [Armatimonadetes bacterium]|nr:branched-chain amino acid ABC transporter substrate-binding protein [Armatimonadota bacterium]
MMSKSWGHVVMAVLVALSLTVPLGLTDAMGAAASHGTVKIATQSPLSGGQSVLGVGIKDGATLGVEQAQAALARAGWRVLVVPFDDQAKPDVGVANAKRIVADREILGVVGHLNSGVAIPSSEVYKDANLVMVSPANTNPKITDRGYKNVNRIVGRDDVQGPVGAQFAKSQGAKSVYIIHDKTAYGQGVAEFFRDDARKLGLTIAGFEGTEEKSSFDAIITPIEAKNPDLIYFGGIYDQAAVFFKQVRERGIKAKFLGPDGMDSPELPKIAGNAVVGMHYTTVAGPAAFYPEAKTFAANFKAKFGRDPEPFAAQAFDSARIIIAAIENVSRRGRPDRASVAAAVRNTKNWKGVTGTISFDGRGDLAKAKYFVINIVSADPAKWGSNKLVRGIDVGPGSR